MPPDATGISLLRLAQFWSKNHAVSSFCRVIVFAADVVIAARGGGIAFQLADHGAGMI